MSDGIYNIDFCNDIRRYGKFIARYDMNENGTKAYNDTKSILVYEYEDEIFYLVMESGNYLDLFRAFPVHTLSSGILTKIYTSHIFFLNDEN